MDCVFIRYAYNSTAYQFLVYKSTIKDIHPNTIKKSRNVILFKDVFPWREAQENHSLKRMIDASSSNHHRSEDDKVELKYSKKEKKTKTFDPDF
jgi:hypothetical protein